MFHALPCLILLLGRAHVARARVHREGHNLLVAQDLIGVCHIHTYVHRKIRRPMNSRAHTRNTANSSEKIAFRARYDTSGLVVLLTVKANVNGGVKGDFGH